MPAPQRYVRKQKSKGGPGYDAKMSSSCNPPAPAPTSTKAAANSSEDLYDVLLHAVMYPTAGQIMQEGCVIGDLNCTKDDD